MNEKLIEFESVLNFNQIHCFRKCEAFIPWSILRVPISNDLRALAATKSGDINNSRTPINALKILEP